MIDAGAECGGRCRQTDDKLFLHVAGGIFDELFGDGVFDIVEAVGVAALDEGRNRDVAHRHAVDGQRGFPASVGQVEAEHHTESVSHLLLVEEGIFDVSIGPGITVVLSVVIAFAGVIE